MKNWLLSASFLLILAAGCARSTTGGGGTGTGNPGLTIASRGYNAMIAQTVTSLSFCVHELRFITASGHTISVPESQLGLIDLADGSRMITWGKLTSVAPGTVISKVLVEIERDPEKCSGANYSVSANGQTLTNEIEFRFSMSPVYTVPSNGTVTFSLSTLVSKIDQALGDGNFNDSAIGNYLDGSFEDTAEGDDD